MTNGDRMRHMSNEELAAWVTKIDGDYICPPSCPGCSTPGYNCWRAWLEWFYKEVKEEPNK